MATNPRTSLPPKRVFIRRAARALGIAFLIISLSVLIGIIGYRHLENLPWIDAYVEAAMISAGMGPSITLHTTMGKLFAGTYALYSGLALIIAIGVMLGPFIHRIIHKFHLDLDNREK